METGWRTVEVLRIGGTLYAYQQKFTVEREKKKKSSRNYGGGLGVGLTTVDKDEHRLVKVEDTVNEESVEKVLRNADMEKEP